MTYDIIPRLESRAACGAALAWLLVAFLSLKIKKVSTTRVGPTARRKFPKHTAVGHSHTSGTSPILSSVDSLPFAIPHTPKPTLMADTIKFARLSIRTKTVKKT